MLFSPEARRDPYPIYDRIRTASPVLREPNTGLWMVFGYDAVKRVLTDHDTFSSHFGPVEWMIFQDPPMHPRLRGLISQAFTPRSISNLEPQIRELSRELLEPMLDRGVMDLAVDFSGPLPMRVIARMLGLPENDVASFGRWNDAILQMSYTVAGDRNAAEIVQTFEAVTAEMNGYLTTLLAERRREPRDDLFTRLVFAEMDGERLSQAEILGFFQLLLLAGSETTTNLINNSILSFVAHPGELVRIRESPELLPSAIEEVLRYRSPLQWMYRVTKCDAELSGQTIPAGELVLAMIGSANRDPRQFPEANRFVITRDPNPHLAFGQGIHFCLGASLARLEARIVLSDLLEQTTDLALASDAPWPPRPGLHVYGPSSLPIKFKRCVKRS
jgi:cytochrome P450